MTSLNFPEFWNFITFFLSLSHSFLVIYSFINLVPVPEKPIKDLKMFAFMSVGVYNDFLLSKCDWILYIYLYFHFFDVKVRGKEYEILWKEKKSKISNSYTYFWRELLTLNFSHFYFIALSIDITLFTVWMQLHLH